MDDAGVCVTADRVDCHDQDLHVRRCRERLDFLGALAAVDRSIEGDALRLVEVLEMLPHKPDARADTLPDCNAGYKDDELGEVVPDGQIEDRAQIYVGLTGACLHLDVEIERVVIQLRRYLKTVPILHALEIREDQVWVEH